MARTLMERLDVLSASLAALKILRLAEQASLAASRMLLVTVGAFLAALKVILAAWEGSLEAGPSCCMKCVGFIVSQMREQRIICMGRNKGD